MGTCVSVRTASPESTAKSPNRVSYKCGKLQTVNGHNVAFILAETGTKTKTNKIGIALNEDQYQFRCSMNTFA